MPSTARDQDKVECLTGPDYSKNFEHEIWLQIEFPTIINWNSPFLF